MQLAEPQDSPHAKASAISRQTSPQSFSAPFSLSERLCDRQTRGHAENSKWIQAAKTGVEVWKLQRKRSNYKTVGLYRLKRRESNIMRCASRANVTGWGSSDGCYNLFSAVKRGSRLDEFSGEKLNSKIRSAKQCIERTKERRCSS